MNKARGAVCYIFIASMLIYLNGCATMKNWPRPVPLQAEGRSGSIFLAWDSPVLERGAAKYNVYRGIEKGKEEGPINDEPLINPSFIDKGEEGRTYYYFVSFLNPGGEEFKYTEATKVLATIAPGEVRELNAKLTAGQVELAWKPAQPGSTKITGYLVYRKLRESGEDQCLNSNSPVSPMENTYADSTVIGGTTYIYKVRAVDNSTPPQYGKPVSVEIMPYVLTPAPAGLSAKAGDGTIELSWKGPTTGTFTVTGYNIFRATESEPFTAQPLNPAPEKSTRYTDTGLTNGTTYRYTVKALLDSQVQPVTDATNEITAVPAVGPGAPSTLQVKYYEGHVVLKWAAAKKGTRDIAGYNIYRGTVAGAEGENPLNTQPVNGPTYSDTDVQVGNTYYYVVSAVDSGPAPIVSDKSNEVFLDLPKPTPPGDLRSSSSGKAVLSWRASNPGVLHLAGYNIFRGTASGAEDAAPINPNPVNNTTFTDTNVEVDKTYYYVVKAVTSSLPAIESKPSNEVEVKITKPEEPKPQPAAPADDMQKPKKRRVRSEQSDQ